jgi:hypothetical protein
MMTKTLSLALTGAVLSTLALVPAARAAAATDIPAFTFDDCPTIPSDVDPTRWRCEEMHASGKVRLGSIELPVTLKTTHAEGRRPGESSTEFIFGTLRSEPVAVPGGLWNTRWRPLAPVNATNLTLEYAGHIDFVAGPPMAEILDLKYKVDNRLLGANCHIGTDAAPMRIVGAIIGDRVPVQDDPLVLRFDVADEAFAVPAASGCGPFDRLVDRRFDIPSTGTLHLTVYFSIRTYDQVQPA